MCNSAKHASRVLGPFFTSAVPVGNQDHVGADEQSSEFRRQPAGVEAARQKFKTMQSRRVLWPLDEMPRFAGLGTLHVAVLVREEKPRGLALLEIPLAPVDRQSECRA